MKYDAIIQCRFSSTRLPSKILLPLKPNISSLDILIQNLKKIKKIKNIILVTPKDDFKIIFDKYVNKYNIKIFSPNISYSDVLQRYYLCSKKFKSKNLIRITSDCPFINIHILDKMLTNYEKNNFNYLTNNIPRYIPHGFDCEILTSKILEYINQKARSKYDREHVTTWYRKYKNHLIHKTKIYKINYSKIRITLDNPTDYLFFVKNYEILYKLSQSPHHEKILKQINRLQHK